MPLLTPGDVHVNRELTNVMIAYNQSRAGFVADQAFPNVPVDFQTDYYYKFGRKYYMQNQAEKRAPNTETPGVGWNVTKELYSCDVWGLHHDIEDQLRANADSAFRLDQSGTELITQQMWINRENEWMRSFFTSSATGGTDVWTRNLDGSAGDFPQFDDDGSGAGSVIDFFRNENLRFQRRTGYRPNVAVVGAEVWNALVDHPEIVDRIKYTQVGFPTEQLVAQALGLGTILVASAVQAQDNEIDPEQVATKPPELEPEFIAGRNMLLAYRADNPSRNVPSAGYTFSWRGYGGADAYGGRIKKFRMEAIAADRIEIEAAYGMKVVAPELGTFLANCVSAPTP